MNLTEEEKEILKAEGLPLPTTLPLTKVLPPPTVNHVFNWYVCLLLSQVEERALKNVRRKIRNRVRK